MVGEIQVSEGGPDRLFRSRSGLRGEGLRAFLRDTRGSITSFTLVVFMLMVTGAGMAIDFMRYETVRAELQTTVDRAVLAAASSTQQLDAADVVTDYFLKSDLEDYVLDPPVVDEGLTYKTVSVSASVELETFIIGLLGMDTLTVHASGAAEERIPQVEISMVLDVSGSMGSYNRLANLKVAAKDFVDTILAQAEDPDLVSFNIVPYTTYVNAGQALLSQYPNSAEHGYSYCVHFEEADFSTTALYQENDLAAGEDPRVLDQVSHFGIIDYNNRPMENSYCPDEPAREIMYMSNDAAALKDHIDGFTAQGNTAIDQGMNWGVALLAPDSQAITTNLIAAGSVSNSFAGRPRNWGTQGVLKVVVLMTDGQHTTKYDVAASHATGMSDIWTDPASGLQSVWHANRNEFWWPDNGAVDPIHTSAFHTAPMGDWDNDGDIDADDGAMGGGAWNGQVSQVSYVDLWAQYAMRDAAWEFHVYESGGSYYATDYDMYSGFYYGYQVVQNPASADASLLNICETAKTVGTVVYTIGFEAPTSSQELLKSCATTQGHHFDVQGLEISDAFATIAASIQKLKLIQ